MNPTSLPFSRFLDAIPLCRALTFGVRDGYFRAHYDVVRERTAAGDAQFAGAAAEPHALFAPLFAVPETRRQAELAALQPELLAARDAEHRAAALEALGVEVLEALLEVRAEAAEQAGLCPSGRAWSDALNAIVRHFAPLPPPPAEDPVVVDEVPGVDDPVLDEAPAEERPAPGEGDADQPAEEPAAPAEPDPDA